MFCMIFIVPFAELCGTYCRVTSNSLIKISVWSFVLLQFGFHLLQIKICKMAPILQKSVKMSSVDKVVSDS